MTNNFKWALYFYISFYTTMITLSYFRKYIVALLLTVCFFTGTYNAFAQCSSWSVSAINILPSNCSASGSFSIQLSGADVSSLSTIKYSIPTTSTGFSVLPNTSPNFENIPSGTYTVKVDAVCGGSAVSKTITVTVGGDYMAPTMVATLERGSLNCGNYGQINVNMTGSSVPYTIKLTSAPAAYTGPLIFTTSASYFLLDSLSAGSYILQVIDTCGTATPTQAMVINSLDPSAAPFSAGYVSGVPNTCDTVIVSMPYLSSYGDWLGYNTYISGSLFQIACSIDGGATITSYKPLSDYSGFTLPLPAGSTYKDYYGRTIIYYIKPPCGSTFQITTTFETPGIYNGSVTPHCDTGFIESLNYADNMLCHPVNITYTNTSTGVSYGPYTCTSDMPVINTAMLPYGNYTFSYITSDGYTQTLTISVAEPSSNPYAIYVQPDAGGLNNYADYIQIIKPYYTFSEGTIVKLISSPPGYSFIDTINYAGVTEVDMYNQTALTATNRHFMRGIYTFKITDACGDYLLTAVVDSSNVYNYTLDISHQVQTCNGLAVYPTGTASIGGNLTTEFYSILSAPLGYLGPYGVTGDTLFLTIPGTYVIGTNAVAGNYGGIFDTTFPNAYQVTQTIVYTSTSLAVDPNNTQGFLCIGASDSSGQIVVNGMGGVPFTAPSLHYKYALAHHGHAMSGPYIAANNTGIFEGTGAIVDSTYDVKITDTCGAFVIQPIKILNLSTAVLASANGNVFCAGDSLLLHAIPMPGATFSWVGPAGFTSTLKDPVIPNVALADSGFYTVTITSSYCSIPASYTIHIAVNPVPPAPSVSIACAGATAVLTGTTAAGVSYQWYDNDTAITGATGNVYTVIQAGMYVYQGIYPVTGCTSHSDTTKFTTAPGATPVPVISPSATALCVGDTAILVASDSAVVIGYQWYFNDVAIAGATNATYNTADSGRYSVQITTGPCSFAISDSVAIIKPIPVANISTAMPTTFCMGDSIVLNANTGTGLTYSWIKDGSPISGATNSSYTAYIAGIYSVQVFNSVCNNLSNAITVVVNPLPIAVISPTGNITICNGQSITYSTPAQGDYTYSWQLNGAAISGGTDNTYTATTGGNYNVVVNNGLCPAATSGTATLSVIPSPDTSLSIVGPLAFCDGGSVTLSVQDSDGLIYQWYNKEQDIAGATTASYTVTTSGGYAAVIDNHVCKDTTRITDVTVYQLPQPVIHRMDLLLSTSTFVTYQWYFNGQPIDGATTATCPIVDTGHYMVTVTDSEGCTGTSENYLVASLTEACIIRLPKAFSPNGDGRNDVFRLIGTDIGYLESFRIENRWGQLVFETVDPSHGWDGKLGGVDQEVGTYYYYIKYKCADGTNVLQQKGDLTLIR